MNTITEIALTKSQRGIFTREEAAFWVSNRGARLDALLKRAVASNEVLRVHSKLFCLNECYLYKRMNSLELAQRIHGPSYVSLEMALSYHGWIPEAVYTITSVTQGRSREFKTHFGPFSFTCIPQLKFFLGVRSVSEDGSGAFFMAEPLKALADYVYVQRCKWNSVAPVVESLRVDPALLDKLTPEMFDEVSAAYKSGRVLQFLSGLRKDLKL